MTGDCQDCQEQLFTDIQMSISALKFKAFRDIGPKTGNLNILALAFMHMNS